MTNEPTIAAVRYTALNSRRRDFCRCCNDNSAEAEAALFLIAGFAGGPVPDSGLSFGSWVLSALLCACDSVVTAVVWIGVPAAGLTLTVWMR